MPLDGGGRVYERFIARQPILDEKLKLAGYELLFRAQDDNRAGASRISTSQLILSSTMLFDWNAIVYCSSAHVIFDAEVIMNGAALLLQKCWSLSEMRTRVELIQYVL